MKYLLVLLLTPLLLVAKVHYAKVEPYDSVILKSAVSGQVIEVKLEDESTVIKKKRVIHIDDKLDKINLENTKSSIDLTEQILTFNKEIAQTLKETEVRQKSYYTRVSKLSTASKTQKDNAYNAYSSAKTQYLSTREKIISLQKQLLDMKYKIAQLKDTIVKKSVILENKYLYRLMVREGDFVVPGASLAKVDTTSRAKLVLFLDSDELINLDDKTIYLNGKKTSYKVAKVWNIADDKFISSYRAEIYISRPKDSFSALMKVEIK